ncbi:MAG: hypothetical protein AAGG81_03865 [Chlamydiota bacterium]
MDRLIGNSFFQFSNYYKQSEAYKDLVGGQTVTVLLADGVINIRELSKAAAVVGLVAYVASECIGSYQVTSLILEGGFLGCWWLSKLVAEQIEPNAKLILDHLEKYGQLA